MTPVKRWGLLAATALPILFLTLSRGSAASTEEISVLCIICGWRGTSDAILNIALFLPFGVALGAFGRSASVAFLAGLSFSVGIELMQFVIPNRSPGLGDLIYNSLGSGLGALIFLNRETLSAQGNPRLERRFTAAWGTFGLALLTFQAWLLGPAIPDRGHRLDWTPVTDYAMRYEADVLGTSFAAADLPAGDVPAGHPVYAEIGSSTEIGVEFRAAEWPFGIAPILRLRRGEIDDLFIGLDYRDIIVQYRSRGMALRLDRPYPRWPRGARTWAPGDTIELRMSGIGDGIELAHSGGSIVPDSPKYDPGPVRITIPTARGWGFLMYPRWAARVTPKPLDFIWMFMLALPLGIWGVVGMSTRFAVAWIAALYLLPFVFPLVGPSLYGALAVAMAVPLGLALHFVKGNPEPFKWWKPFHTLYDSALAGSPPTAEIDSPAPVGGHERGSTTREEDEGEER